MNELTPPAAKKSTVNKFILPVLLVIAGVGALGYFASKAGLDRALVKQEVDAWIERSKENAAKEGYKLAVTYDDVAIKGGLTDGHALISNIKVITTPEASGEAGEGSVTFATAEVKLEPKSASLQDVNVILPSPIRIFEGTNATESATLSTEKPMVFEVEQIKKKAQYYNRIRHDFDSKISFRYLVGQDATGEEDQTPELAPRYEAMEIIMDGDSSAQLTTHHERSDIGESIIDLNHMRIVPVGHEEGTVKVQEFRSRWSNELNEKSLNVIDASLELKNLTADEKFLPYAPISASFSVHFEGAMPETPEEFAKIQSQQTVLKISDFSFRIKDADVNATADFMANQEDILPVGMANISVKNVPAWHALLKENEVLNADDEEVLNTLFIRILGKTLSSASDVSVDIQRAREGSFQIGHITFEEVLAILLRKVKTPLDVKLPEAPAAEEPATQEEAAPVEHVEPADPVAAKTE